MLLVMVLELVVVEVFGWVQQTWGYEPVQRRRREQDGEHYGVAVRSSRVSSQRITCETPDPFQTRVGFWR